MDFLRKLTGVSSTNNLQTKNAHPKALRSDAAQSVSPMRQQLDPSKQSTVGSKVAFSRKGTTSGLGSSDRAPSNPLAGGPQGIGSIIEELIFDANGKQVKTREYVQGQFMGKGGFARCYVFEQRDSVDVFAAKIIDKENLVKPTSQKKLMQEIQIHQQLIS